MDLFDIAVARKLSSGGGGGGGSSDALVVHLDEEGVADATWQEITDALSNKIVVLNQDNYEKGSIPYLVSKTTNDDEYIVWIYVNALGEDSDYLYCDSANDYPYVD